MKVTRTFAAHYGEYILHPVELPLHLFFNRIFDCGSFEDQKQSVSNAFQYVVLCPTAPSTSDDITAYGQIAIAKIRIIFRVYNGLPQIYTLFNRKAGRAISHCVSAVEFLSVSVRHCQGGIDI